MNDIERAIEQLDTQIKCTVNTVSIKSCQIAIDALEKQIPKKTITFKNQGDITVGKLTFKAGCTIHKCPVCESVITSDKYCRECGQLLDRNDPVADKLQKLLDRENERFKG